MKIAPLKITDPANQANVLNRWSDNVSEELTNINSELAKRPTSTAVKSTVDIAVSTVTTLAPDVPFFSASENGRAIDGVIFSEVTCTYTAPDDISNFTGVYLVAVNYLGSGEPVKIAEHTYSGVPSGSASFKVDLQRTGETITLRFISKNLSGLSTTDWGSSRPSTTVVLDGNASPPAAPSGLVAAGTDLGIWLDWNENLEANIKSYNIYRNTTNLFASASIIGSTAATGIGTASFFDKTGTPGSMYFYWITGVNNSLQEGTHSGSASATVGLVSLDNTNDGSSRFARTGAHSSYRPQTNPLTAHDAGSNITITIAAFTMVVGSKNISCNSGTITGLSYGITYYIYYDDQNLAGGAVTYHATTTKITALQGDYRFFVGSILTPLAGRSDRIGNNDGGVGNQTGLLAEVLPATITATSGWNNPNNVLDGDDLTLSDGTATSQVETITASSFPTYFGLYSELAVQFLTKFTAIAAGTTAYTQYSYDNGLTWHTGRSVTAADTGIVFESYDIPLLSNTANVQMRVQLPNAIGNVSGTPATWTDDASVGTVAWSPVGTTAGINNVGTNWTSHRLSMQNPGTTGVPGGTVIQGIEFDFNGQVMSANNDGDTSCSWTGVQLYDGGTLVGSILGSGATVGSTAAYTFGGPNNLWGQVSGYWTAAKVGAVNFGVALEAHVTRVTGSGTDHVTINVTSGVLKIYYTFGSGSGQCNVYTMNLEVAQ